MVVQTEAIEGIFGVIEPLFGRH